MTSPLSGLLLAAAAAIAVSGCGVDVAFGDDTTEWTETETIDVADLSAIRVDTSNGAVEIVGGARDTIDITARLRESSEGEARFTVREDGDVLTLDGECDGHWWSDCKVGFEVRVPPGFDVDVDTDSGRIAIDGIDGDVRASSDNGAIVGDGLTADDVSAETDNGAINIAFDDAPERVSAITDNGAIEIRVGGGDTYDVEACTDNGAIDIGVRTDPDAERSITTRTDNGSIDVAYERR